MAMAKSGSYEWRKALPKTSSFDNIDFMSATMSESGVKGAAEIKAAVEALKGATGDDAVDKAEKLAQLVSTAGVRAFCECGVVEGLKAQLGDRATSEAAFRAITALCQVMTFKAEPFMVPFLPNVLAGVADKKSKEVRDAAEEAGPCIIAICSIQASKNVQPFLFAGIAETNWQTKMWALRLLGQFAEQSDAPFSRTLYQVVPVVSSAMWDTKKEVKEAARAATLQALNTCQNRDIRPFIPAVIEAIENPSEVPETLHKLSSTVFVQSVDNPALSIAVPILMRGTQEKKIESKRRVCVIADNMCKLIDYAHEATTFMPELMPAIARLAEEMSDPEARQMANKALKTLKNIQESAASFEAAKTMEPEQVVSIINDAIKTTVADNWGKWISTDKSVGMSIEYAAVTLSGMIAGMLFVEEDWKFHGLCPYLAPYMSESESQAVCKIVYTQCYKSCVPIETQEDEHDEGEDLCNCEFSLGYGARILLNNTRLHLKRGKRYGVCGYNGCGKSTLMKVQAHFDAPICHPHALHARMQTDSPLLCVLAVSRLPAFTEPLPLLSFALPQVG
jgi:elongation factor 3